MKSTNETQRQSSPGTVTPAVQSAAPSSQMLTGFLRGLINIKDMSPALRTITIAGFALLGGIAVALAAENVAQPYVMATLRVGNQSTETPLLVLLVFALISLVGYAYILAGAMQLRALPRYFVVATISVIFGLFPFQDIAEGFQPRSPLFVVQWLIPFFQIALLIGLWDWATSRSDKPLWLRRDSRTTPAQQLRFPVVLATTISMMTLYMGLEIISWLIFQHAGRVLAQESDTLVIADVAAPVAFFPLLSPLAIYWFSTNATEWGEAIAGGMTRVANRRQGALAVLTILVAAVTGLLAIARYGISLLPAFGIAALFMAAVRSLMWLAPSARQWPRQMPFVALVVGAITLFCIVNLPILVTTVWATIGALPSSLVNSLTGIVTLVAVVGAATFGFVLAGVGRLQDRGDLAVVGLVLALIAILTGTAILNQIQADIGIVGIPQPVHLLGGIELFAAVGTLAITGMLIRQGIPFDSWDSAFAGLFIVLIGLQIVDWYGSYALDRANSSPSSTLWLAAIFLASAVWDILTSGKQGLNGDSPAIPRASRVLLFFGYTLLTAALLLYGSSLRTQGTGMPVSGDLTGISGTQAILATYAFCIPLTLVAGLLRWQRWRAEEATAQAQLKRDERVKRATIAITGGGAAIVTLLIVTACNLAVTTNSGISTRPPVTIHPTPSSCRAGDYCASAPGPQCDQGGAMWASVPGTDQSTQCTADGLQLSVQGGNEGAIGFQPHGGTFAPAFSIAVTVNLSGAPDGCATIEVDVNGGIGAGNVCAGGEWVISALPANGSTQNVAQGQVQSVGIYQMTTVFDSSHMALSINGTQVGQTTQITSVGIDLVAIGLFNTGSATESATFRDFAYRVLP
jgi:hypothetical protein